MHSLRKTLPLIAVLVLAVIACRCGSERAWQRHFFSLDTVIDITLFSSKDPGKLLDSLQKTILQVDSAFSISNPASDIWRINHRTGPKVAVRRATASIISFCTAQCDSSGHLFDITVAPLKYLYGLESHQTSHHVPTAVEIENVLKTIGCDRVKVVNDTTVMLDSGTTIDLGGVAKGYLFTILRTILFRAGQRRYLINFGGDLITGGDKPGGKPWIIGIRHPRRSDAFICKIPADSGCVFTSGDYERFFIENDIRYHHVFDPGTGLPGRKNMSATVIGGNPLIADVSVKIAFLMNAPEALKFLKQRNMTGLLMDSTGTVWASKELKKTMVPDSGVTIRFQ